MGSGRNQGQGEAEGRNTYYLVKWAGRPSEYNSYEPAAHLANAPDAVAAYERKLKRKRNDDGPARKARRRRRV